MKWMGNFKDLTGMKFNMLTVLEQAERINTVKSYGDVNAIAEMR